jgi:hypothetical protein
MVNMHYRHQGTQTPSEGRDPLPQDRATSARTDQRDAGGKKTIQVKRLAALDELVEASEDAGGYDL